LPIATKGTAVDDQTRIGLFAVVLGSISSANDETEKKKNAYQSSAKTIPNFKRNKALGTICW
jgi:hypothetical protein